MPIDVPTRDEVREQGLEALASVEANVDTSPDTLAGALLTAGADFCGGVHVNVDSSSKDIHATSAMDDTVLEKHAEIRLGTNPWKAATKSSGTDALRVTGTHASAEVTPSDTLEHDNGNRYVPTESVVVGVGTADISVESIDKGASTELSAGAVMNFESAPSNIEQEATVVSPGITGGEDKESAASLLGRFLHAVRNPLVGGRFSDYWKWATDLVEIAQAYCYGPHSGAQLGRRGLGIIDAAVLVAGTGSGRIPSAADVALVQAAFNANRPDGTADNLALLPTAVSQDVDLKLTASVGYDWDWTGSSDTVQDWTAGSKKIELNFTNTSLEDGIAAAIAAGGTGARIMLNGELLIADLYTSGTGPHSDDEIRLTTTPSTTPSPGDDIWPGGPLTAPAQAAVKEVFDNLGPARETWADPDQLWDDTLRLSKLSSAAVYRDIGGGDTSGIQGCDDVVVITPSSNVTPDDVPPAAPELLVYGTITIRPA